MIREDTDQTFLGKALIRKGTTSEGEQVITISGVFKVTNIEDFDDGDEMWVCRLVLDEAIKHYKFKGTMTSPEDFMEDMNRVQAPENWEIKPGYNRRGRG